MLSVWLLYPAFIVAFVLSVWSYIRYASIPLRHRLVMVSLRVISLFIILFLLLNPRFDSIVESAHQPEITLLVDDSRSINTVRGDWDGERSMRALLAEITEQLQEHTITQNIIGFSTEATALNSFDELRFDKSATRIYDVLTGIDTSSDLVILISDGVTTSGRDALFATDFLEIPLFTLAVGDTSEQADLILSDVNYPSVAYVNSQLPVRLTVRNEGFESDSITVLLRENNQVIQQFTFLPNGPRATREVEFTVTPNQTGILDLTATIVEKSDEWSVENNIRRFNVNVLDDKMRVLHLGFEIHPDIGFLRRVIQRNASLELTNRTWLGTQNFVEGTLPSADSFDVLIIHGLPDGIGGATAQWLQSTMNEKPVIFFLTPSTNATVFNQFTTQFAGSPTLDRNRSAVPVQLRISEQEAGHPILNLSTIDLSGTPPLLSPISHIRPGELGSFFLYASVRGESTSPVLQVMQQANLRRSFFMAYNINRWLLRGEPDEIDWLSELLYNLIDWTAANPSDQFLDISPVKTAFSGNETIEFRASLTDASGNPESAAQISVVLNDIDADFQRTFTMNSLGAGRYELDAGILPTGSYTFEGSAQIGNQILGEATGTFQVGGIVAELLNTRRNDMLLEQLAKNTGGVFATHRELPEFLSQLQNYLENPQNTQTRRSIQLNHSVYWFLLLMILLTGEWLMRRRFALP